MCIRDSTNTVSKASTTIEKKIEEPKVEVVKVEVPTLTIVEKAHKQKQNGFFSTYLPHVGKLKGDDFRNCVNSRYWDISISDSDTNKIDLGPLNGDILNGPNGKKAMDFCSWHARIGKYQ